MNSQDLIATLVITRTRTEGIMSHKCKKRNLMTFESFGIVLLFALINFFLLFFFAWLDPRQQRLNATDYKNIISYSDSG